MITAAVIDLLAMLLMSLLDALPVAEVPEWLNSSSSLIPTVFNFAGSMGVWFPWATLATVTGAVLLAWGLAFGMSIIRIIISHLSGGGGST